MQLCKECRTLLLRTNQNMKQGSIPAGNQKRLTGNGVTSPRGEWGSGGEGDRTRGRVGVGVGDRIGVPLWTNRLKI